MICLVGYSASRFKISKRSDERFVRYGRLKKEKWIFKRELNVLCVFGVFLILPEFWHMRVKGLSLMHGEIFENYSHILEVSYKTANLKLMIIEVLERRW